MLQSDEITRNATEFVLSQKRRIWLRIAASFMFIIMFSTSVVVHGADEHMETIVVLQEPIPAARCNFKSWMDWRAITSRSSRQWRLQQIAYTCDNGLRRVDGLYMIALGTYFLHYGVGDVFEITLSSDLVFRAVVGDVKSDAHTDPTNRFHLTDGSVVEFIVDRNNMPEQARRMGDMSFGGFPGYVVSIVRLPDLFIAV